MPKSVTSKNKYAPFCIVKNSYLQLMERIYPFVGSYGEVDMRFRSEVF